MVNTWFMTKFFFSIPYSTLVIIKSFPSWNLDWLNSVYQGSEYSMNNLGLKHFKNMENWDVFFLQFLQGWKSLSFHNICKHRCNAGLNTSRIPPFTCTSVLSECHGCVSLDGFNWICESEHILQMQIKSPFF